MNAGRASAAVPSDGSRPGRVIDDLRRVAQLTSDEYGAQRVAFTPAWEKARDFLRSRLAELSLRGELDEVGNLWATLPGSRPDVLVLGGHLDSVPNGGWLDGVLGVFTGLEVLRRLADRPDRPLTVSLVDWADEEGARFAGRSTFGSGVATGTYDPTALADLTDADGVRLGDAVAAFGVDLLEAPKASSRLRHVGAYLELHIEQGPVLEGLGLPLAAVTGTIGVERHAVSFAGQAAHAGATAMDRRRDAFLAAARTALSVRDTATAAGGFGTCGQVALVPGIATAVAGRSVLSVDLRHEDQHFLQQMLGDVRSAAKRVAVEENVDVSWAPMFQVPSTPFHPDLVALTRNAIGSVTPVVHAMPSATLHDATRIAQRGIPTGMLFVQSLGGISHTKEEDTSLGDLELAVMSFSRLVDDTIDWLLAQTFGPNSPQTKEPS